MRNGLRKSRSAVWTSLALILLLLLPLVSCQKKSANKVDQIKFSKGWNLAEAAKPWKGETLRFIGESLPPLEALANVKSEFEKITGVKVEIEQYGQAEVIEKTMADFVGKTQVYDMILSPHRQLGTYVKNDWLLPLDQFMKNEKLKDPSFDVAGGAILDDRYWHEVSWYDGQAYGLPFHFISMYLWYRYDIFEHPDEQAAFKAKYGYELPSPPVNMKEFYDTAAFFTRKKGERLAGQTLKQDMYGVTLMGKRHVSTWYDYLNILYAFGGKDIDSKSGFEYGKITINSPEAVKAMEFYKSMAKFCPPGLLSAGWDESQAAMQQDIAVMGLEWDDAVGAVENPKESMVAGKIAYSGVPIETSKICQIEGWNYHIPKLSKKPELAWLFVQWAMATQVQKEQMARGGQSAIRAVYNDPEVAAKPYVSTAIYLKTGGKENLGIREKGAKTGWGLPRRYLEAKNPKTGDTSVSLIPKPTFPEQEELMQSILLAVSKTLSNEMSAKDALDEAAQSFATILKDKVK